MRTSAVIPNAQTSASGVLTNCPVSSSSGDVQLAGHPSDIAEGRNRALTRVATPKVRRA